MNYQSLIILSLIFPLHSVKAKTSSCNYQGNTNQMVDLQKQLHVWETYSNAEEMKPQMQVASIQNPAVITTHLRTWRGQNPSRFQHYLRNTHGVLNIFGWGTLLPIGAIAARYFRKFPFKCSEWYSVHITCQSGGYIVGTVGWCSGMFLGNSSKQQSNKTHRVLGIIIFTFTTIQMLAMFWRRKGENGFPKYVKICHHLLGYALIALTIANIFEGINNRAHAAKWKWTYVGILCVLGVTALGLEIFKWIKRAMMREAVKLNSNMYTSP
ncbi:PREDICTED: cytochrome b561 [Prunus dulcis]|uniref:PREDICTED: cytochrome b561 n=2 Tax=Prunus dulcis TaxID=3755 RepID=A0A5E4F0H0_PRUDU|nr:hypothetical protein L3X38_020976 [Prunus dulcis]VVA21547.1 PREDICTED: cytochrome b561 [Prunus dulcis]